MFDFIRLAERKQSMMYIKRIDSSLTHKNKSSLYADNPQIRNSIEIWHSLFNILGADNRDELLKKYNTWIYNIDQIHKPKSVLDLIADRIYFANKSLFCFNRSNKMRLLFFSIAINPYFEYITLGLAFFFSLLFSISMNLDYKSTLFLDLITYLFLFLFIIEESTKIIDMAFTAAIRHI